MDSQVEEIKDRISIVQVVEGYVKLQRAGKNMRAKCPFHKEKTASFFVSPERGTYMCFGCGEKGDIFSFVQRIEGVDFNEALKELAERAGVTLRPRSARTPEQKGKTEKLLLVCEEAALYFESVLHKHRNVQAYMEKRGVKKETIISWRIGYAPAQWKELSQHLLVKGFSKEDILDAGLAVRSEKKGGEVFDRFRGRIMFPIYDAAGNVIAFSGRFFEAIPGFHDGEEPAKYVNSPETLLFKKSRILYGFNRAKQAIRRIDCILLVEGQFDLILCHQSGLPFSVALSGTALTLEHLSLLGRLSKRLVLALDADIAGLRSGLKSAQMALLEGFDVKVVSLPEGKDPAEVAKENPESLKKAIRSATTAVEFFLEILRKDIRDERAYKKVVEARVLPLIVAMKSKIDQAHFIIVVARALEIPESAVEEEVTKMTQQTTKYPEQYPSSLLEEGPGDSTPSHERAAAMVLSRYDISSDKVNRIRDLLGETRVAEILKHFDGDLEEMRFSFDMLGDDPEEITLGLMSAIECGVLEEELKILQKTLRSSPKEEGGEILKRIAELKRRQEELRK